MTYSKAYVVAGKYTGHVRQDAAGGNHRWWNRKRGRWIDAFIRVRPSYFRSLEAAECEAAYVNSITRTEATP